MVCANRSEAETGGCTQKANPEGFGRLRIVEADMKVL